MGALSEFFTQNIILIYFLYGLAFFSMGLAVWLESARSSDLRFARALRPLAAFGLMHGVHEWGEMFEKIVALTSGYQLSDQELAFQNLWLVASFMALAAFGAALIVPDPPAQAPRRLHPAVWEVPILMLMVWLAGLPLLWPLAKSTQPWLIAGGVLARYVLGIPAGLLAAWGLVRQQHTFREQGLAAFGRDSLWAAIAFGWYALIGQIFVPRSVLFPSTIINSDLFFTVFGVPVQFFRAIVAAAAALFVVRFLRAFEVARARQLQELQDANLHAVEQREALRGDLLRQIVTAQEAERQRIARELHDETGQALTALGLGLRAVRSALKSDPDLAERNVTELETMAGHALDELRRVLADLRPSHLDDLGLVAALRWYAQEVEARTGMRIQVDAQIPRVALSPEMTTVLFRIAQEALTNVVRHARARQAAMYLECGDHAVRLTIRDDGQGFDVEKILAPQRGRRAWGLIGMQERAMLVGGQLDVRSTPGRGTEVTVTVPTDTQCRDERGERNGKDQAAAG